MNASLIISAVGGRWDDDIELFRVSPMDPSIRWDDEFIVIGLLARNSNNPGHQRHKHYAAKVFFDQALGRLAQA